MSILLRQGPVAATMMFTGLAACGSSSNHAAPPPRSAAAKPDVIITIDGVRHACVVALIQEENGSAVSCADVAPFVKDELRLATGSIYEIRSIPDVDEAELGRVTASLRDAGYRPQ